MCCVDVWSLIADVWVHRKIAGKAKAAAAAASARQDITLALSQALPSLLRKFNTDPTKVLALFSFTGVPLVPSMKCAPGP